MHHPTADSAARSIWAINLPEKGFPGTTSPNTGSIDWFDYCQPGDIYGDANLRGTYLRLGYELGIELTLSDPIAMIAGIAESLIRGELRRAIIELGEAPAVAIAKTATTAGSLALFLWDNPHVQYGDIIPGRTVLAHSANHLNFWGGRGGQTPSSSRDPLGAGPRNLWRVG